MTAALVIVFIDFIINYLVFSYQRGTLLIARNSQNTSTSNGIAEIQGKLTPTWLGLISWLNWLTLALAIYLLWNVNWWFALLYLIARFILVGLIPTFDRTWADYISSKYNL